MPQLVSLFVSQRQLAARLTPCLQVRTILSQNTTDTNSSRAFAGLKAAFPEWEAVRTAPEGAVEESVRCGGLADIKVARMKVLKRIEQPRL
jgi:endonuclease-3